MMKTQTGRIIRSLSGFYDVQTPEGMVTCRGRGSLRRSGESPLTGDIVEITSEKQRLDTELSVAADIQLDMLPTRFPAFPNRSEFDLYAVMDPAKEVGGDFYDFFLIDKDHLCMVIADVSGKGIPASLVMAVTCRLFRSVASYLDKPEEIIASLNDSLADGNESNMFCTAFLGVLDLKTGHLRYCNAGHNAPLLIGTDGRVRPMNVVPNLPLGLFGGFPYEGQELQLDKQMMLYLFTDGVNEAENNQKELFGDLRLASLLRRHASQEPSDIIAATFDEVHAHAAGAEQSDDITVMCIKYC